ncbi:MAG: hypothetical protein NC917_06555 [Candidatus Omnitrophica bacterium]|nr:hypothetical protein [Candidatus Omnitrophota bacterium]MCM8811287.1 hypothetical protein [Candidatus Omnitrophota bacterium]
MKETIIKNFIFLNLAVFIYSLGWFFKSNFYLSFIFFIMSFFLFLFLFKNKNYNSIVLPGENIKQPFILFWVKTFIGYVNTARNKNGDIKLANMNVGVKRVYEMIEFNELIKAYNSIEDAKKDFLK